MEYKNEIYNELIKVANAFYGRYESFAKYIEEDERKKFIDELVTGCEPYEFYPKEMFETFIDLTIEYIDKYCPKSDLVFYSIKKLAECTERSGDGKFDNCTMGIMMRFLKEDDGRVYTLVKKFEEKYDSLDGEFNSIQFHNSIVHSIDSFLLKRGIPCFSTQKKREETKRELFMLRTYAHNFMRKLISESQEN